MLGQLVIALIFYFILQYNDFATYIHVPGTSIQLELGWGYALLIIFMLVGASNAVNLTDGLDGLLAGTAAIAFGAFGILAWYGFPQNEVTIFSLAAVGALLGFWYSMLIRQKCLWGTPVRWHSAEASLL